MISATSYAIVRVGAGGMTEGKAALIAILSALVCIVIAIAFEPIEIFTKRVGSWLTRVTQMPESHRFSVRPQD